jgi:hypothetical protein
MLHDGWCSLSGGSNRPTPEPFQCCHGTHPPVCLASSLKGFSKVDEAHERSVYTDLLLAILKKFVALLGLARSLTSTWSAGYVGNVPLYGLSCHRQRWMPLPSWNSFHPLPSRLIPR